MALGFRLETLITAACNARACNAHSGGGGFYIEPCYPSFWHFLGALIRVPVQDKSASYADAQAEALKIWTRLGDRGWADLCQYTLEREDDMTYFPHALVAPAPARHLAKHHPAMA